jgi:serine/threonine protein kinase
MDTPKQNVVYNNGTQTPPLTPLTPARKVSTPGHADYLQIGTSLDTFSLNSRRTTELLKFPSRTTDYILDKKNLLGSGLWSDVYFAPPTLPSLSTVEPDAKVRPSEAFTPPLTPVKPRSTSLSIPSVPQAYAIKVPAMTAAKAVIASEARILSYLSSFPTYSTYVVPFFGLDTRNGAIIMSAMKIALESFITKDLNTLNDTSRTTRLAAVFPTLALNLVRGLECLDAHDIVHADIKPANILLADDGTPVFADFSSSILTLPSADINARPAAPVGGGTWDFLCPSILTRDPATSHYPAPSTSTDVYSLAVTLLFVVIGHSPFDAAGSNVFRRRDMIKQGAPLAYAFGGDDGAAAEERCKDLSAALGWDVVAWLQMGLRKVDRRAGVQEWRGRLERLAL